MKSKLHDEFKNFYSEIKLSTHNALKEKREILQSDLETKLPEKLKDEDIATITKSNLRFIDQGSWAKKVKTSIKPKKQGEDGNKTFDRDVAVIIPLDINKNNDPRKIKKIIRDILKIEEKRIPKIKDPCVTITYSKEGNEIYHIDFPVYAKDENEILYLARGKENASDYKWEEADPEGLNEYFESHFEEDEGKQKRRMVRYIKQWKQEKYTGSNGNEIPPSIGLTILTCENFVQSYENGYWNDLESLYFTLKAILENFTEDYNGEVNINCNLPRTPYSDIFFKMRSSQEHLKTFYNRFKKFVDNVENAYNAEHAHEAAKYVVKSLGDKFEIPEKQAKEDNSSLKRESSYA